MNKLAQYVDLPGGAAGRRREILQDSKFPPEFKGGRYNDARRTISNWFVAGGDPQRLVEAATRLRRNRTGTDWAVNDRDWSATAIEAFQQLVVHALDPSIMGLGRTRRTGVAWRTLTVARVAVSVAPDVVLYEGAHVVGLVKLHLVANHPMSDEAGDLAALLLQRWAEQEGWVDLSPERLIVIDVLNGRRQLFTPPRSTVQRMRRIEETCAEIARQWAAIEGR
ncbi:MAG: hypothetical protein M9894_17675 [Planctomycetes bacterium]|nr:hypothetical protein [Planctomycetota bacterium]